MFFFHSLNSEMAFIDVFFIYFPSAFHAIDLKPQIYKRVFRSMHRKLVGKNKTIEGKFIHLSKKKRE